MKIYLVGGAVRDQLLNFPVKERDWVVVGATVQDMISLGFRQVGKEFPVFLHPRTNEEYALARMERKTKPGYKGFSFDTSPSVSLEDDLKRRDLTINAMAQTKEGQLIDPYHGKQDLDAKLLRHVSDAFIEDPVRILRVGRFLARYANLGFKVAPVTTTLMRQMVNNGEVNALVAERVWKELERALGEKTPEAFFTVINDCGALNILFPNLSINDSGMRALSYAKNISQSSLIRFASVFHALPVSDLKQLCQRYRVPSAYKQLALLTALHFGEALKSRELSADELVNLLSALDVYRREARFRDFLLVIEAIATSKNQHFDARCLLEAATIAKSVDVQSLIKQGFTGTDLATKLKEERLKLISTWLKAH